MNLKRNMTKVQKGFTSLEIMIGIAIVGILVAIGLIFGYKLVDNNRGKSEVENMGLISQKIRELYAQDASYTGLSDEVLIKSGVLNDSMIAGSKIINAWKQPLTVGVGADKTSFTITSNGISKEQCVKVANSFRKQAINLTANGTSIVTDNAEVAGAVGILAGACTNANNVIMVEMR